MGNSPSGWIIVRMNHVVLVELIEFYLSIRDRLDDRDFISKACPHMEPKIVIAK
jgi:hypothetical protein